jgi:Cu/Ag efflux protein CusF
MSSIRQDHIFEFSNTKEQIMKNIPSFALALAFALPLAVNAADTTSMKPGDMQQGTSGHGGMGMGSGNAMGMGSGNAGTMSAGNMQGAGMSQGVIRKVDKSGKKITIKHGPLLNLDMPAMTMVFKVTDPAMLQQMRAGDKVDFVAERVNGVLTITKAEAAK